MAVELTAAPREQSRARYPDADGYVERDGVRVFYEVYGSGEPTILLLPTWSIIHSRQWKAQIPYLARHHRVVTYDGRGNGRSDRPTASAAYDEREFAADALAVLDATATDQAVLLGYSLGAQRGLLVATAHPERVLGAIFVGPAYPGGGEPIPERVVPWEDELDTDEGWAKYNKHYWLRDYRGFVEFFFSRLFSEPHSTKPIEDCVGWALETTPETLIAAQYAATLAPEEARELARASAVPGARRARDRRSHRLADPRRRARRAHRRRPRAGRGQRPRPARARPGRVQPDRPRVRPIAAPEAVVIVVPEVHEQTRARYPDEEGYVERDGVRVFYEVYGSGEPTVVLLPTWALIHSRHWKLQIPYLARHCRVVTFDGRGNGRSDRPHGAQAYAIREFAADTLAVMDATATERAVLVGVSCAALWGVVLAAEHPERVAGAAFIGSAVPLAPPLPERTVYPFDERLDIDDGWAKYNIHHWLRDYRDFLDFFIGKCFTEPHSTKPIEDAIGWALETSPEVLADHDAGIDLPIGGDFRELCGRVRCPVLVMHGDEDALHSHARGVALAEATGGQLVTLQGSGHFPQARDPVVVNLLVQEFVERLP